jgi:predicted nucleic acid-binding protein
MPDKVFIDSNIIIYAYSVDELKKQAIARELLNTHETILISTQTINEFVNVTTRKKMLSNGQIAEIIDELFLVFSVEIIDQNIIKKALNIAL